MEVFLRAVPGVFRKQLTSRVLMSYVQICYIKDCNLILAIKVMFINHKCNTNRNSNKGSTLDWPKNNTKSIHHKCKIKAGYFVLYGRQTLK